MSTSGAPILVSNTSLQSEEPWLLEEMADSRAGAESIEDEPGNFCNVKSKKVLKKKNNNHNSGDMPEGHRSQPKELPMAKCGIM